MPKLFGRTDFLFGFRKIGQIDVLEGIESRAFVRFYHFLTNGSVLVLLAAYVVLALITNSSGDLHGEATERFMSGTFYKFRIENFFLKERNPNGVAFYNLFAFFSISYVFVTALLSWPILIYYGSIHPVEKQGKHLVRGLFAILVIVVIGLFLPLPADHPGARMNLFKNTYITSLINLIIWAGAFGSGSMFSLYAGRFFFKRQ